MVCNVWYTTTNNEEWMNEWFTGSLYRSNRLGSPQPVYVWVNVGCVGGVVGYFVPTNKEKNEDRDVMSYRYYEWRIPSPRRTGTGICVWMFEKCEKTRFRRTWIVVVVSCCCTKQNVWRRKRSANVGKNETTIEGIIIVFRSCCMCIHFREYIHCSHMPIVRQFCSNEVTNSGVPYELCVINAPISIWVTNRGLVSFIRHRKSHCHLLYHWRTTNGGFVWKRSHERDQQCHV